MPLLEARNITKNFGGVRALDDVNLDINEGEIIGLIGPNGAGKTTLINIITGFLRADSGKVLFKGEDITGKAPHIIARKGVLRTFQHLALWKEFSVIDNVQKALYMVSGARVFTSMFNTAAYRRSKSEIIEQATKIIEFVGMEHCKEQKAKTLSHGYQKTLSLAIGLATRPPMLFLDEPVAALNPERVTHIINLIKRLREQGTAILIIEHNMRAIFDVCDRIVVLNAGRSIAEGTSLEIKENKEVIAAYLGGGAGVKH
jgi:branched-chain amino acid transport system ATP-binding protein